MRMLNFRCCKSCKHGAVHKVNLIKLCHFRILPIAATNDTAILGYKTGREIRNDDIEILKEDVIQ